MSNYNLSDNVNDSFEFTVSGLVYKVKYPLMEQLEGLQEISREIENKKEKNEDTSKLEKKALEWMYSFISPVTESAPSIEETLQKQNFKVIKNFNTMLNTEFGIE